MLPSHFLIFLGSSPRSGPLSSARTPLSRAPRHALAQRRKHPFPQPSAGKPALPMPTLSFVGETICCNLKVPCSRHTTSGRRNYLLRSLRSVGCSGEKLQGAWPRSVRSPANRHSARARPTLRTPPGHSERKLTHRDSDAETPPHPRSA